jgi:hypothetical protein
MTVRNQKYILEDGTSTDYLRLCNNGSFHHYSASLCDLIEMWSDDLSYDKVSQLLRQITGVSVLSAAGVQSYLACKSEHISKQWVAEQHSEVSTIAVVTEPAIYESTAAEVIIMLDDVGVKAQKPHKNIERTDADAKRLDTTVVLVQDTEQKYHYAMRGVDKAGKTIYSVQQAIIDKVVQLHKVEQPLPVVAITDGARSIRITLHAIFGLTVCIILDWYHLQLKIKNLMSMIAPNKTLKVQYCKELKALLWYGKVADAIAYIEAIDQVKNEQKLKELRDYLEKHQHEIINYDLRKKAGKTIGSGRCEKANDLIVAHRQKKKGMAWSKKGSAALAVIRTQRVNLQNAA